MSITKAKRDKIRKEILDLLWDIPGAEEGRRGFARDGIDKILKAQLSPGLKPSSAKGKGRRAQQWLRDRFLSHLSFVHHMDHPDHVRSTPMGVSGEDLQISPTARQYLPFACEIKNSERIGFWPTVKQAEANANGNVPLILFTKNRTDPWIAVPAEAFLAIYELMARSLRKNGALGLGCTNMQTQIIQKIVGMNERIQEEETERNSVQSDT